MADAFQERFNGIGNTCHNMTSPDLENNEDLDELFDEDVIRQLVSEVSSLVS
jgi:hypothetical protein